MPRRNQQSDSEALRKTIRTLAINAAVDQLIGKGKENENGRLPPGEMRRVLLDLQKNGVETNRDHLNYEKAKRLKTIKEAEGRAPLSEIEFDCQGGDVSTYHDSNDSENKKRGRPVGTTIVSAAKGQQLRVQCINEITQTYAKEVENNQKVSKNIT
jgi:hypothetical protein